MTKRILFPSLILVLWMALLSGCGLSAEFDRGALLENTTTNLILPQQTAFIAASAELESAANNFAANPTAETLDALQASWREASLAWMPLTLYRYSDVDDALLHNPIDNRPARESFIEETIASDQPITPEMVDGIGSSSKGLAAIEVLIFGSEGDNSAVLAQFTSDPNAPRRMAYLTATATHLTDSAEALHAFWQPDQEDYATAFIEADMDGGDIQSSINMIVNQLLSELEGIINQRLGKPLGKSSGGDPHPELVEALYSDHSLPRIIATVEGMQALFNGSSDSSAEALGLDDYLDFLDATYENGALSDAINAQFEAALAALSAIDQPLDQAIENQPEQVEAAYQELRTLLVLLKSDMVNQLGVTITFNDNDGD